MYYDVVNVQPRFNFSHEIIILNLEQYNFKYSDWDLEHWSITFILGLLFRIKFKESLSSLWHVLVLWLCVCLHTILTCLHLHTCHIYLHRHISETVKFSKATVCFYASTSSSTLKKYGCLIGDLTCLGEIEAAVCTIKWHSLPRVNQNVVIVNLQPDRIINITNNKIMFAWR